MGFQPKNMVFLLLLSLLLNIIYRPIKETVWLYNRKWDSVVVLEML
jgi:hypothetical protein